MQEAGPRPPPRLTLMDAAVEPPPTALSAGGRWQAVAEHQRRFYGLDVDPQTQVLVTAGATEAIAGALLALCAPGDEVVVLEPYYDAYAACIELAGARRRTVLLRFPDYTLEPGAL